MLVGKNYLAEAHAAHTVVDTEFKASNSIRTQYRSNYSEVKILVCIIIIF